MIHRIRTQEILTTLKPLFFTLYHSVGIFLIFFIFIHIAGSLYTATSTKKAVDALNNAITQEMRYLKLQGDAMASAPELIEGILQNDYTGILAFTQRERVVRGVGLVGVANREGVIISRTFSPTNLGQNVFLTVPAGRVVAQGKSIESIEMTGFGNQLFMTTARPVMYQGTMIGALFANYLTHDEYARKIKETYLPKGTHIVFYTQEFGVYGTSFTQPEVRKLIDQYFNAGSDFILNETLDKTVSFPDGSFFLVRKIVFPGLEQSPGGALIFVPRRDMGGMIRWILTCIMLLIFIGLARINSRRSQLSSRNKELQHVLVVLFSIPLCILTLQGLLVNSSGYLKLKYVPFTLYNSTMRIQPDFGIFDADFEQHFSVMIDTGNEAVNAVEVELVYDPQTLEVKELDAENSACKYVVEQRIEATTGRVYFSCVILKPEGEKGVVKTLDLVVVPHKTGVFTLDFDKENTRVLASDGLGTNVLRHAQGGSYRVDRFDTTLFGSTTSSSPLMMGSHGRSFVVFSPTHPNQSRWYNSKHARFVWIGKPHTVYKYEFDNSPDTIPSGKHSTPNSFVELPIVSDGIFYFHLQSAEGGTTVHYAIKTDQTSPNIMGIKTSNEKVIAGEVVRFSFEAEDIGSGVQENYYVDLGNHLFLPISNTLFIPFLEPGDQKIVLRVYDSAGNYSEKTQIIKVENASE